MARFGPAGNSQAFYDAGYKSSREVPAWLAQLGLSAYEYQCGRGVRVGEALARDIGREAARHDIALSIHAPYYINLATREEEKQANTCRHLLRSLELAHWMGASRVVFHPGGTTAEGREADLAAALQLLEKILEEGEKAGWGEVHLAPETMGKPGQLGNLAEVLTLCRLDRRIIPTLDFAHLHAVSGGGLTCSAAVEAVLKEVSRQLGNASLAQLHVHFSPIEFGPGGEKRHGNLSQKDLGPPFTAVAAALKQYVQEPTIICESQGQQAEDAQRLQAIWQESHGRTIQAGEDA